MNTGLKLSALLVMLVIMLVGVAFLVPPAEPKVTIVEMEYEWVYVVFACDRPIGVISHAEPPIWLAIEGAPYWSSTTIDLIDKALAADNVTEVFVNEFCPEKSTT